MREFILILKRSAFQHFCDSSRCYTFCSNFTVQKCENCANCECICTKPASVIYIYSLRFHISDSVFTHCDDWTDWSTREFWKPVNMLPFCNFMQTCLQLKLIEHVGQLMFLHSVLAKIYFSHYLGGFHQPLINQFPNSSQPYIFAAKSPLFHPSAQCPVICRHESRNSSVVSHSWLEWRGCLLLSPPPQNWNTRSWCKTTLPSLAELAFSQSRLEEEIWHSVFLQGWGGDV